MKIDQLRLILLDIIKECEDYAIPSARRANLYDMDVEIDDLQVLLKNS